MRRFNTQYWETLKNGKVQCNLCPRFCKLSEGQRGLCYVRGRENNQIYLYTYGRSSGFCIDPIEKKPLNHFYPGTPILSFGTAGCNLACKFCQNWDISKSREMDTLSDQARPDIIAQKAHEAGCKSIAFTYNDPVIFLEYAKDCSIEAHKLGLKTVSVTAGYINERPREDFYSFIDATNVDLKAFTDDFYKKITGGSLRPVLETLLYLKNETDVWFEITTLLIPGFNDSTQELNLMTQWIYENLGPNIPLHFSAFHPDYKMMDIPSTSSDILKKARQIALNNGLYYVYTGNIHDVEGGSTYCPNYQKRIIERDWCELIDWKINSEGKCQFCQNVISGQFESIPGNWGRKRVPLNLK